MKAKRLLAMLMVLVIMLSLMPISVLATDTAVAFTEPTLFYREPVWDENGTPKEDPNAPVNTHFTSSPKRGTWAIFYFFDGTTVHRVPDNQLFSDNENIVTINLYNEFPILQPNACGSANICYTHTDGKTYKLPVISEMFYVDFYSTSTPSEETFLRKFTVTKSNRTFYLAALDGFTIHSATPSNNWPDSDIELAPDGSYAKITIKPGAKWDTNYGGSELRVHLTGENGINWENSIEYIILIDGGDKMVFRYAMYEQDGTAIPDPSWVDSNYYTGPFDCNLFLFMSIDGKEIMIAPAKVACADPSILQITPDTSNNTLHLSPIGFGKTALSYTHTDGQTYSLPVSIDLPEVAFYTRPEAKDEYYIKDFVLSDTNDTVYLVARNEVTLSDIELSGFPAGTTVELSADKTVATIVMGHIGAHGDAYAHFYVNTPEGQSWQNGMSFQISSVYPTFAFHYAKYNNNGNLVPNDVYLYTEFWTGHTPEPLFPIMLINGKYQAVDPAKVYPKDESVIQVEPSSENPAALQIENRKIGKTELLYKHTDGVTYSIPVTVERPFMGFYTSPEGKDEDYIFSFQLNENNNVIYLVADEFPWDYEEILPVIPTDHENFPKGTTFEKTDKANVIKITIPTEGYTSNRQFTLSYRGYTESSDGRVFETEAICDMFVKGNAPAEAPFTDVAAKDYFYEPVLWAVANGITGGLDATHFGPNNACTRGQVVTFLWRAYGSPEPKSTSHPFTDINENQYFYKAVLWAVENGITSGLNATTFGPNNACTRGQIATFLWRANGSPEPQSSNNPFSDVNAGPFYKAILWAVEEGVTGGYSDGTFRPNNVCTRGNIVTFLFRAEQ